MNPLLQNNQQTNNLDINKIIDFAKNTSPQSAKSQIEQMLSNGSLSQSKFNELSEKAKSIAKMLGM